MISTRHIRHDWKTWVEWPQKTVRAVCDVTTRSHLAGIPGITDQPILVPVADGKVKLGWCYRCAVRVDREIDTTLNNSYVVMRPHIRQFYIDSQAELQESVKYARSANKLYAR